MSFPTLEPAARLRKSRTRTRNVSAHPAIAVSTLKPHQYDLRPACASLICPNCKTWCPITGIQAKVQKLVPHHASTAGKGEAIRCPGSNRRVIVDVKYEVWWQRLEDGVAETDGRRSNRVMRKPKTPPAPAVTQVVPTQPTANSAHAAYRAHRQGCAACTGRAHCTDGTRLAATYLQLLRDEPRRQKVEEASERLKRQSERSRAKSLPERRQAEWAAVRASVFLADLNRIPQGVTPDISTPDLPLEPIRITG